MKYIMAFTVLFSLLAFAGESKYLNIGDPAPYFTAKNYDGKEYGLKKTLSESKFTVLMFISTECPVSNAYNERMKELQETFSKKGVAFVGINSNKQEDVKMIASHSKEHGFKFPVLKDERNKVADLYGAQVTPETFVLDPQARLLYHGRIDDNRNLSKVTSHDLADALDKLLAGKELTLTTPRAFGCSIKRMVVN